MRASPALWRAVAFGAAGVVVWVACATRMGAAAAGALAARAVSALGLSHLRDLADGIDWMVPRHSRRGLRCRGGERIGGSCLRRHR